jgi:NAD(P)-dependent dehydrogenase (short-subunit alcohol dehydrogenase family)
MAEAQRLYGMKALVTSGAGGIGEAVARTLTKHGASVVAIDGANSGVDRLFTAVRGVEGLAADANEIGGIPALIDTVAEKLGTIDIVVNEFSPGSRSPIAEDGADLARMLESRNELIMATSRAALPYLKKSPAGRIVNIGYLRSVFAANSADAAHRAERDLAAVTRALAAESGKFGITANYVQPGGIMTGVSREVFRKNKDLRDFCIRNSAAGRLGEPVDVAKVVLFLASDDAVFVSGAGIAVDGGRIDG